MTGCWHAHRWSIGGCQGISNSTPDNKHLNSLQIITLFYKKLQHKHTQGLKIWFVIYCQKHGFKEKETSNFKQGGTVNANGRIFFGRHLCEIFSETRPCKQCFSSSSFLWVFGEKSLMPPKLLETPNHAFHQDLDLGDSSSQFLKVFHASLGVFCCSWGPRGLLILPSFLTSFWTFNNLVAFEGM